MSKHALVTHHKHSSSSSSAFKLWHCILGHPSFTIVNTVLKACNLPSINKDQQPFCRSCCLGKIHKFPFPDSQNTYSQPLELIHSDVWGPTTVTSSNGFSYYVHFIYHYSHLTWVYFLKRKSDVKSAFQSFKLLVENQFNTKIKALQIDGAGEFIALTSL